MISKSDLMEWLSRTTSEDFYIDGDKLCAHGESDNIAIGDAICSECDGSGWNLCLDAGHEDQSIDGRAEVQRCDSCHKYDDDDEALRAFMAYVEILERTAEAAMYADVQLLRRRYFFYREKEDGTGVEAYSTLKKPKENEDGKTND